MRRILKSFCALGLGLALLSAPAHASPSEVSTAIPGAQKVGDAHYRTLGVSIFLAELWTDSGAFSWERPFALSLTYDRAVTARTQINRAISEMSGRGAGPAQSLAPLRTRLQTCLPNVARGDRLTAVSTGPDTARFYVNGAQRCTIEWPGFRRAFFGMWLAGRDGPAAVLSARLRGEA